MDELAKEDHTYHLSTEEKKRYQGQWYLTLNKAGKNGPMKLRSDFRAAVSMKNRLNHESGEQVEEPIHRGVTSLNGIGNELIRLFLIDQNSFCYSWFRLQSIAIHSNRRGV